ncbi:Lipopolysaccharide ABC transporter, ATP-binding protein LptB [hydrothermal vent metagenome]|uniref:Lipopolysaccharide ABC transporter, ATP-binding protein LptB n=1 Tax=hydrothermal vent metagenome TaxID=652676 RepID=A0A1W1CI09_9ZZZZ
MEKHLLVAKNINKSYNGRLIVKDVSFYVQSGEVVSLLGPNGAGKTTCFYMMMGLVQSDSGLVYFDKENITTLPMYKRARMGIGYLPQEASIFRKLTVEDNILAILQTFKEWTEDEQLHRLEELLKELNIGHIRYINGISLSGGERRRVEIARALAMNPKFILLDEPFAGVDPISVGDIQEIIFYLREKGIGVLITDHNVRETLDTCDHSYVLHDGVIIAEGDRDKVLADKTVQRVYLGDNFIQF